MENNFFNLKVALVHDYLVRWGGAEKVLFALHKTFPQAPIYTLAMDKRLCASRLPGADVRASFLQKFPPFLRRRYRWLAPLIISAAESIDLSGYDLVISSSSAFVNGAITPPETLHICYCHTPPRFLWDYAHQYKSGSTLRHFLRLWDFSAADRADYFVANSRTTKERIKKYYRKDSTVIYPPVAPLLQPAEVGLLQERRSRTSAGFFFLIVSPLRDYKRIDIAIEAFNKLQYPLVIIGEGPARKGLEKIAAKNIQFWGWQNDEAVGRVLYECKAFILPGEEDFGIAAIEAMLAGKPVVALRRGGATETVIEGVTGEFFDDLHPATCADAVRRLQEKYNSYSPLVIQKHAERFSEERFQKEITDFFRKVLKDKQKVL